MMISGRKRTGDTATVELPARARSSWWKEQAVAEYGRFLPTRRTRLRTELASRLFELTGTLFPPEDLYVDTDERFAVANVDGASFRLYRYGGLVLVRPCGYCGTGRFESPAIKDRADLGRALSDWSPLHEDCDGYPAEDLADF